MTNAKLHRKWQLPVRWFPLGLLLVLALLGANPQGLAAEGDEAEPDYSRDGADACLRCHDEDSDFPVLSILKTPHAVAADSRTPFAQKSCESCHGPGADHAKRVRFGQERPPIPAFGKNAMWSEEKQNGICLGCHQRDQQMHWQGGTHQRLDVACADCHRVHETQDPVTVASEEARVCYDCHREVQSQAHQRSAHPMRFGEIACSDCHEPHGSLNEAMLKEMTSNDTCYGCHAEKRGPFLWEHAPVADDCTSCHQPHGSNQPAMLTQRPPLLCQQCHSRAGHPSIAQTPDGLPAGNSSGFLLGGSCLNCHSQVHGSNHPSGANLSR